jgi:DNA repair protein RecO (recombination protein O)
MRTKDKAIVLQNIKHGDKKFILKLYTKHNGLITVYAVFSNAPSSKIKSSAIMSLAIIDVEFILKQNKNIYQLTEATTCSILNDINQSIIKLSIAQFLNEILIKTLKEQHTNIFLFEFIETNLKYLNELQHNITNLHVYFLIELTKYLGIEPQNNYSSLTPFFDCREGQFNAVNQVFPLGLTKEESYLFFNFLNANALEVKLSNTQRQIILDALLAYYSFHIPNFGIVKSVEVLKEVVAV